MSCILQCLFFHIEAVVGISDGILVHFLCPYNGSCVGKLRITQFSYLDVEVVDIGCLLAH